MYLPPSASEQLQSNSEREKRVVKRGLRVLLYDKSVHFVTSPFRFPSRFGFEPETVCSHRRESVV